MLKGKSELFSMVEVKRELLHFDAGVVAFNSQKQIEAEYDTLAHRVALAPGALSSYIYKRSSRDDDFACMDAVGRIPCCSLIPLEPIKAE